VFRLRRIHEWGCRLHARTTQNRSNPPLPGRVLLGSPVPTFFWLSWTSDPCSYSSRSLKEQRPMCRLLFKRMTFILNKDILTLKRGGGGVALIIWYDIKTISYVIQDVFMQDVSLVSGIQRRWSACVSQITTWRSSFFVLRHCGFYTVWCHSVLSFTDWSVWHI